MLRGATWTRWAAKRARFDGLQPQNALEVVLRDAGMLNRRALRLRVMGLTTVDDLRFLYASSEEAEQDDMSELWQYVSTIGSGCSSKTAPIVRLEKSFARRSNVGKIPIFERRSKTRKVKKRADTPSLAPEQDSCLRIQVAERAVALSLTWKPFGLSKKCGKITQTWLDRQYRLIAR